MQVTFLGTGEAIDPSRHNSSILLEAGNSSILLDCGFTTPHNYFTFAREEKLLQAVWISHFHGDHFLGLPLLLLRLYQSGRRETLAFISGVDAGEKVTSLVELAYPGLLEKLSFSLEFIDLTPGSSCVHNNVSYQIAEVEHSQDAYGLRLEMAGKSIYYSGDGRPTPAAMDIMKDSDLVIHEAFTLKRESPGHSTVIQCLEMKRQLGLTRLALIHLSRELRGDSGQLDSLVHPEPHVVLPEDGDVLTL